MTPISSSLCKRRLSSLLSLKTKLNVYGEDLPRSDIDSEHNIFSFAKHFLQHNLPKNEEILSSCSCPICQETVDQKNIISTFLHKRDQELEKKEKLMKLLEQKKKQREKEQEESKNDYERHTRTTTEMRSRKGIVASNTNDQVGPVKHQPASTSSNHHKKKDPDATKNAILSEVRSLIQGMKDDAVNVSEAVKKSSASYEQRQHSLASQVEETAKATKKAKATENEMNGSGNGGAVAEAILNLLGKIMPMTVVNSFLRPLIESIFQMLWVVIAVFMSVTTMYLMITAPKARY